jgi:hypothetical protein
MRANDFITELISSGRRKKYTPDQRKQAAAANSQQVMTEDADAGGTTAGTIGAVVKNLGEMPTEVIKRQKGYTNQLSKGGAVNIKKSK